LPEAGRSVAIVKRLAERLSGRLEVTNAEGTGSTFSLYLPLEAPAERAEDHPKFA
jgi:signal transduction histidine kinase